MEKGNDNQAEIQELSQKIVGVLPYGLIVWEISEPNEELKMYVAKEIVSILNPEKIKIDDKEVLEDLAGYVDKYREKIYLVIRKIWEDTEFKTKLRILKTREELRQLRGEVERSIVWIRKKQNR